MFSDVHPLDTDENSLAAWCASANGVSLVGFVHRRTSTTLDFATVFH